MVNELKHIWIAKIDQKTVWSLILITTQTITHLGTQCFQITHSLASKINFTVCYSHEKLVVQPVAQPYSKYPHKSLILCSVFQEITAVTVYLFHLKSPYYSSCRNSHRRCSLRKGVLRNFANFTGKHLCQSLFFNKAN